MDVKQGVALFFLIIVGVYFGNMWSHRMIKEQERREAEYAKLLAASQHSNSNGTTV